MILFIIPPPTPPYQDTADLISQIEQILTEGNEKTWGGPVGSAGGIAIEPPPPDTIYFKLADHSYYKSVDVDGIHDTDLQQAMIAKASGNWSVTIIDTNTIGLILKDATYTLTFASSDDGPIPGINENDSITLEGDTVGAIANGTYNG